MTATLCTHKGSYKILQDNLQVIYNGNKSLLLPKRHSVLSYKLGINDGLTEPHKIIFLEYCNIIIAVSCKMGISGLVLRDSDMGATRSYKMLQGLDKTPPVLGGVFWETCVSGQTTQEL